MSRPSDNGADGPSIAQRMAAIANDTSDIRRTMAGQGQKSPPSMPKPIQRTSVPTKEGLSLSGIKDAESKPAAPITPVLRKDSLNLGGDRPVVKRPEVASWAKFMLSLGVLALIFGERVLLDVGSLFGGVVIFAVIVAVVVTVVRKITSRWPDFWEGVFMLMGCVGIATVFAAIYNLIR